MDNPNNELFLLSKANANFENIRKAYGVGGVSMAEILNKIELNHDLESMATAEDKYIPSNLLKDAEMEASMEQEIKKCKTKCPDPYIPGKVYFSLEEESSLNQREQATCLNALLLNQSSNAASTLTVFQKRDLAMARELQSTVHEENVKFTEYAKGDWNFKRCIYLKTPFKSYASLRWKEKLQKVLRYPQFYKTQQTVPITTLEDTSSEVIVNHVANVLEVGIVPKFVKPSLECQFNFKPSFLPSSESTVYGSKLNVSNDPNIAEIIKTGPIDIVISSAGLKQLMDDSNHNGEWHIPVVVKKHEIQLPTGLHSKTVVYIDKPAPRRYPTAIDFGYYCMKLLVKTNLCYIPGITYNTADKVVSSESTTISCEVTEENINVEEAHKNAARNGKHRLCHNASYRIWNMKSKSGKNELLKTKHSTKDLNVLIRCKLDACEHLEDGTLRPLVVVPKLEYQIEHGACIPTKKEIIDQWTSLFFRPYSNLYRVRLMSNTFDIIDVQNVTLQKLNNEASTFHNYKPHLRLNILYEIFSALTELQHGNYLLLFNRNNGPFIEIGAEIDSSLESFNYHQHYNSDICSFRVPNNVPWIPIDPNYVLPVHITFKRMPGMFRPLIGKKSAAKRNKKKKKNKTKKKQTTKQTNGKK